MVIDIEYMANRKDMECIRSTSNKPTSWECIVFGYTSGERVIGRDEK